MISKSVMAAMAVAMVSAVAASSLTYIKSVAPLKTALAKERTRSASFERDLFNMNKSFDEQRSLFATTQVDCEVTPDAIAKGVKAYVEEDRATRDQKARGNVGAMKKEFTGFGKKL